MKKLLLLFIAFSLIGCKEKIINYDDITIVDDIAYYKSDMTLVTGKVRDSHDNGRLWIERTYKDGKAHGVWKEWYDNGQLARTGTYNDDEWDGVHKYWDEYGKLQREEIWKDNELISTKEY